MILQGLVNVLIGTAVSLVFFQSALLAQTRTYVSSQFKYKLTVPTHWNIEVSGSGVPVIFNYALSEGGPQGLFPENGANIFLIPLEAVKVVTGASTMDEWIRRNLAADHKNVTIRHIPSPSGSDRAPQNVVEVQADFERNPQDDQLQRELDFYFTLRGSMFRLMLVYWKDSPHAAELRSACESILRSIRSA